MTVTVAAQPVAALRAQLSGNSSEHRRLRRGFNGDDDRIAYSALGHAAFYEAVGRRFTRDSTAADVVRYVADVRSRFDEVATAVDPRVGEQLILEVLGKGTTDGADTRTAAVAMQFLLTALVADEGLDSAALDEFIAKARKTAEFLLNGST